MTNSLLLDKTFERFDEMEKSSKTLKGLYNKHDNKEFILDKSKWTESYMDGLMVEIINNFSHERIAHLKEVISYIYEPSNNIKDINNKEELKERLIIL